MLTKQEIQIIFDALDAWEKEEEQNSFMTTMLGAMLISDKDKRDEFMDDQKAEHEQRKNESIIRKEKIIMLKAKLLTMKDKAEASEAAEFLRGGK